MTRGLIYCFSLRNVFFKQAFPSVMYKPRLRHTLLNTLLTSVLSDLSGVACSDILNKVFGLYLNICIPSELKAVLADVKNSKKIIKMQCKS